MSVSSIVLVESVGADWDWFCSFTVAKRGVHPERIRRDVENWKNRVAGKQGLPFRLLLSALRLESGLDAEHVHGHALIGGLRHVGTTARHAAMHDWEVIAYRYRVAGQESAGGTANSFGGTCRIRLYDPAAGAAGYLSKQLNASELWGWLNAEIELSPRAFEVAYKRRRCATA